MVLHRLVYPSQCFSWNTGKWLPWTFDFLQLSSPNFKNLFSVCPRWPAVTCMTSSFIPGKNVSTLSVLWYRCCRLGTVKFILYLITLRHNYYTSWTKHSLFQSSFRENFRSWFNFVFRSTEAHHGVLLFISNYLGAIVVLWSVWHQ